MKITFLGAAQTVTGSCFVIETDTARFAVDCGMHQGNTAIEDRNKDTSAYRASDMDFFLVTHAHIDHSGLLPKMAREGFKGPIYCTKPTADLLGTMLADSAHIQEMEADWANRKGKRRGAKMVEPLYTGADAAKAVKLFSSVVYGQPFEPAAGVKAVFRNAGHILGAAFLELEVTTAEGVTRMIFSGDLGRPEALLVEDAETPNFDADYLFLESTYGDRDHKNEDVSLDELAEAIRYSYSHGEKVIIPAFAVERTQEVLFSLHKLAGAGRLPEGMPVYVDSPLAIKATQIFRKYPEWFDQETRDVIARGFDPFEVPGLRFTATTQESQAINAAEGPAIVLSASGMCNAGRIKHHLRHNLWRPGASIVFVGYQGMGTPGRKIVDGASRITMLGEETVVAAKIFTIGGFSAHAGQSQILDWVRGFSRPGMQVLLVHGEEKAQTALAALLEQQCGLDVRIPGYLEEMTLVPGRKAQVRVDAAKAAPKVDWEIILADMDSKMRLLRERSPGLSAREWPIQAELRDQLLHINNDLLRFVSQL